MSLSNQVYRSDEDLNSFGNPYAGRQPMLQLTFGDFKIAAISPDTATIIDGLVDGALAGGVANLETNDYDTFETTLPKIELSYTFARDNWYATLAGGYNTYEASNGITKVDVYSYIGAVGGHITLGSFYFAGNFYFAQNTGPYNLASDADDMPAIVGTTLIDNDSLGYIFVGGMKLNDTFSFEAGYGYTEAELDQPGSNKDAVDSYYIQSTVTLARGVFFVPEIGAINNKNDKNGNEQSEIFYYGIKWQINF